MSHPAQPSFVWQLYHYDLEPNASLFAVESASEHIHVQWNELTDDLEVINNAPTPVTGKVHVAIYALDGTKLSTKDIPVTAAASSVASLGTITLPATPTPIHFIQLELVDTNGTPLSKNLYWRAPAATRDDLTAMDTMPVVNLATQVSPVTRSALPGKSQLTVTLKNPTRHIALMAHLQLRNATTTERVLPVFYSDNYISLTPGETRTITVSFAASDLHDSQPLITLDGWNIGVAPTHTSGIAVKPNTDAQVSHWPVTGLPFATQGLR
jgi:hypothetical protein